MSKNLYNLDACEKLIERYQNYEGGQVTTISEGVLGLGVTLLHGATGKKTIVIREKYINPWQSGHSITKYNKMPKKYQNWLEKNR